MIKRIVSALLVLAMAFSIPTFAEAKAPVETAAFSGLKGDLCYASEAELIELFDIPTSTVDGYVLESVEVDYVAIPSPTRPSINAGVGTNSLGDYVGNARATREVYFPSEVISSDYYDGPTSSVKMTFEEKIKSKWNANTEISVKAVKAGVGFEVEKEFSVKKEWERPAVASNQKLNVKVYGNYQEYSFTVYDRKDRIIGSGYAYKPVGLYIAQATYKK